MTKNTTNLKAPKRAWIKPELVTAGLDLGDVKFGFNAGTDGAGGFTTSLSS